MSLIFSLPSLAFARNPILVIAWDDVSGFVRFRYKLTFGSEETEVFEATRDSSNQAKLDLQALARVFFVDNYPLPSLASTAVENMPNNANICKSMVCEVTSQSTSDETISQNIAILRGGMPYELFPTNTFLTIAIGNLPKAHIILSSQPAEKVISPKEKHYLTFLCKVLYDSYDGMKLRLKVWDENNVSHLHYFDISNTEAKKVSRYNVSFNDLVAPLYAGQKPIKYQVDLVKYTGTTYYQCSDSQTYVLDYQYYPQAKYFLFVNSLGGLDSVWCRGESSSELEVERNLASKYVAPDYSFPNVPNQVWTTEGKRSMDANTGYFEDFSYMAWLDDFFLSKEIWEVSGNVLKAIQITTKKKISSDDDRTLLPALKIEYQYLYPQNAYFQ